MKILFHALRYRLRDLPFEVKQQESAIEVQLLADRKAKWKNKDLSLEVLATLFNGFEIKIQAQSMSIPQTLPTNKWKNFLEKIETFADLIAKENLQDIKIWGNFPRPHATGFKEGTLPQSSQYLQEVYADKYISPEKKGFIIDLRRSNRSFLISADDEAKSFFDAASQIGSLALGYNDPEKRGILMHPEHYDVQTKTSETEIFKSYQNLLKKISKMPHVYFFNSGAEANEAALQLCVRAYPKRKKLMAFSGSFHGRMFLTLHLTHSPSKRLPFETYSDIVNYAPYPETKTPSQEITITEEWRSLWSDPNNSNFGARLEKLSATADTQTKAEIESLLYLNEAFKKEEYLATIIEPRQCEGGDRYGTKRFYHALRLLTRAYDIPLIFDEVQTGFGLGGPFFWHSSFELKDKNGKEDFPDCITFAKKAQVSGVLTRFEGPLQHEVSSVSIHRGYIQAMSHFVHEPVDYTYVEKRLTEIQSLVGKEIIQNIRGMAQNFAFDLPSDTLLNKLISYRFEEGILFYPAGDKTARFRLLRNFTKVEIDGLFTSLYMCFLRAAADKLIPEIPSLDKWLEKLSTEGRLQVNKTKNLQKENPWKNFPKNIEEAQKLSSSEWQKVFSTLLKEQRDCVKLASNTEWSLKKLSQSKLEDIVKAYESSSEFTWMDFLWQASRLKSWNVQVIQSSEELTKIRSEIERLEKETYEKARQTPYEDFEKCIEANKGLVLVTKDKEKITGISASAAIKDFNSIKLVCDDPLKNDKDTYYSIELVVDKSLLHQGLGLRLKTEQILELTRRNGKAIRSRNRFPEASAMIRLNHGFGSQVLDQEANVYSDGGVAYYQSLRLSSKAEKIWNPRHPSMLNKGSLANFVSPAYIDNMLILKELLPASYRHVYLASSTGEALDKAIKCFRLARPKGKIMFGFEGDYFGNSTTSSATLSGETSYFNWPLFKGINDENFEKWIEAHAKQNNHESILGCALEWKNNTLAVSQKIKKLQELKIPTVLKECSSSCWKADKKEFVLSGTSLNPDIFYFWAGPQVAVVACKETIFVDKALTMISTWDGDEHGLCLFQDRIMQRLGELP